MSIISHSACAGRIKSRLGFRSIKEYRKRLAGSGQGVVKRQCKPLSRSGTDCHSPQECPLAFSGNIRISSSHQFSVANGPGTGMMPFTIAKIILNKI